MNESDTGWLDESERADEARLQRLSRLGEASLRINKSLDFDTVLQEVVDSARALTGSRYGALTVRGEAGELPAFFVSGLTSEEHQGFWEMPEGLAFFEYLSGLDEPLRVPDVAGHLRSLGMPEFLPPVAASSLLVAPIRHRGVGVGTIYLGHEEQAREFASQDKEALVMFASHAALVIANARQYRDENRARANLATLIDTSPVGVVVLDAKTGVPVSFNRETTRIVGGLCDPGQSLEELLEVLTYRRADGRERSLKNVPLVKLFSAGESVRAEEIMLRTPDGRSVTVLLNATPIHSETGEVESYVATLQDMAPLEATERMRAEFLAMVSHELRAPLATIKGSVTTLLESAQELDLAEMTQFFRIIGTESDKMRELIGDLLDLAHVETGALVVAPEPSDLYLLLDESKSRFASGASLHDLQMELAADLPPVMADPRRTVQVLTNLLANAAGNSPVGSTIRLSAEQQGAHVAVSVADQGRGISAGVLPHLFRKFFRPQDAGGGTGDDGSGLGLAICKGIVEAHGGRIWAHSDGPGRGARFTFTMPVAEAPATGATLPPFARPDSAGLADSGREPVLAVDDDPHALSYIRSALAKAGYAPVVTGDPAEVPSLMAAHQPRAVLLDLMLPDTDGLELMHQVQSIANVPVIFVSVYGQDDVITRAIDLGAADYIVKPFSPTELAARVGAALRGQAQPPERFSIGDLDIDHGERQATLAGQPVHLTPTEYGLLYELAVNAGQTLTHDTLLRRVWGADRSGEPWLVREVIKRLRRKLGDTIDNPRYILTQPRVGYRIAQREAEPAA
ncbi:MAG: response regulator [bacterium]|nr:response regulator [bacterium]